MTDKKPANVVEAILAAKAEIGAVGKDEQYNDGYTRYDFRGVDGIVNATDAALTKYGVLITPYRTEVNYATVTSAKGKPMRESTVKVVYRIYGPGGVTDCIDVEVPGESLDTSDKGTAKAMSVAFRIAQLQALHLPTQDRDPDADAPQRGEPEAARDEEAVANWIAEFTSYVEGAFTVDQLRGPLYKLLKAKQDARFVTLEEVAHLTDLMKAKVAEIETEDVTSGPLEGAVAPARTTPNCGALNDQGAECIKPAHSINETHTFDDGSKGVTGR